MLKEKLHLASSTQSIIDQFGNIDQQVLFTEYKRISAEIIEYTNSLHTTQHRVEELEIQNIELNRCNKLLILQSQAR